ncbi:MAG TPA: hypothetical protein VMR62_21780 [Bryobacteraceae bacterium]|jgi:hypothetical protein|nr:hypothetical protein [Bryobacteraceae bacterium]
MKNYRVEVLALALAFGFTAWGQENRAPMQPEAPADHSARHAMYLMRLLDNAIWIPDGQASQKQLYVFVAPWCGYSQKAYMLTRGLGNKVQIRWIVTGGRDRNSYNFIAAAALQRDPQLLETMYKYVRQAPEASQDVGKNSSDYNYMTQEAFAVSGCSNHWNCAGFPTFAWLQADGVHYGDSTTDVPSILSSIVERPEAASIRPGGLDYLAVNCLDAGVALQPIRPDYYFSNLKIARGHARPDAGSPIIEFLPKDKGHKASAQVVVDGERWIRLCVDKKCDWAPFFREKDVYLGTPTS